MTSNRTISQTNPKFIKGKVFDIREGEATIGQIIKQDYAFSKWVVRFLDGTRVEFAKRDEAFAYAAAF
jgi:hypothetical protein